MQTIHLICNAHLDPVWQWEWEEGAAEAISTFRTAADLCEEFDGFVFSHNEAILYRWVEEFDPILFGRMQRLVREGKWHIMGGWYLQPDCNMPSGESFVRQILIGKAYFKEKFGVQPTTAINFDPFGHTRGLAQILKKSGYDSYLFCRPGNDDCPLPADDFIWVGYDGSEIQAHRSSSFYNSPLGKAREKIEGWLKANPDKQVGMALWGVGDHGGGPSREDLQNLSALIDESTEAVVLHSTPEAYFQQSLKTGASLPRHAGDLNSWAVGCYTSQVRLKQKHRLLENELYMVEKMLSHAMLSNLLQYPQQEMREAFCDLMTAEFHDILPGSSVKPVEEMSLRLMDHGLEIASRLKARAFFALAANQAKPREGEIPILAYNPHPHAITGIFEVEFMLPDQNWKDEFTLPIVCAGDQRIPSQPEKELSNLTLDWRKRVVFHTELQPCQMNRFDCKLEILPRKPVPQLKHHDGKLVFKGEDVEVAIDTTTGFVDEYRVRDVSYLRPNAFQPLVVEDDEDPWGMRVQSFRNVAGTLELLSSEVGTRFSGVTDQVLDSVRVIEEGEVRTVIEAVFGYGDSFLCQRYKLPKRGSEIEVEMHVHWNEKSKMLKLSIPTVFTDTRYLGQVAYGLESLPTTGKEVVAQKWVMAVSEESGLAFSCINDGIYGSDFCDGEIRLSLLRSAGYAGHPIMERPIMPQDRFSTRIDQGERLFRFWFNAGPAEERLEQIHTEALAHNEKPFVLSFFPSGTGDKPQPLCLLSDPAVQLIAFKKAEDSDDYIVRLFEPTGQRRRCQLDTPVLGSSQDLNLDSFEIKTLRIDPLTKAVVEVSLMED